MYYFSWGCRGNLTLITLRSERVKPLLCTIVPLVYPARGSMGGIRVRQSTPRHVEVVVTWAHQVVVVRQCLFCQIFLSFHHLFKLVWDVGYQHVDHRRHAKHDMLARIKVKSSKSTFSQPFKEKCIRDVARKVRIQNSGAANSWDMAVWFSNCSTLKPLI